MRATRDRRGFTIVEIMAVVIIIGILAALVIPQLAGQTDVARVKMTKAQISEIETGLNLFKLEAGRYPTTAEGLGALVTKPGNFSGTWPKDGYMAKTPKDAWNRDFAYVSPGKSGAYDIVSYGADGVEGGEDENADITN